MNKFFVFLCAMLLSLGIARIVNAEIDIDTTIGQPGCGTTLIGFAPGDQPLVGFGSPDGARTETMGQTFTVTDPGTSLNSFTFYVDNPTSNFTFRAYVMKWEGGRAVPSEAADPDSTIGALFESDVTFSPTAASELCNVDGGVTINIEAGLSLDPGTYVAFFSTSDLVFNSGYGSARWWARLPEDLTAEPQVLDPYNGGSFVQLDSGNLIANILDTELIWDMRSDDASDSAFIMTFSSPIPPTPSEQDDEDSDDEDSDDEDSDDEDSDDE